MKTPYLKQYLKELDRDLRKFPRNERAKVLDAYRNGLEASFHNCYPDKFPSVAPLVVDEKYGNASKMGSHVGGQFSPLEVESAREFLLAEVEKRKVKFSRPRWFEQYYDLFSLYGLFGKDNFGAGV